MQIWSELRLDRARKTEWQRENRRKFKEKFGYSTTCNYGAGKNRQAVLERDGFSCVSCGMSDIDHKLRWDRPITIDHIDKNRKNNSLSNLQTLCLECHGNKDLIDDLRKRTIDRNEVACLKSLGKTYQEIANITGYSIGGVWKAINGEKK